MRLITPKHKKFWSPSLIIPSGGLGAVAGLTFQAFATEASATATATYSGVNFGTANANRVIAVILVARHNNTTEVVTGVTIGGIAASAVTGSTASLNGSNLISIWYASVPTGTSGTVVATFNAANNGGVTVKTGIYVYAIVTTTPTPTTGQNNSGTGLTTLNVSMTVPASGFGIVGAFQRQAGNTDSMVNAAIDGDNTLTGSHQFFCGHTVSTGALTITANSTPTGNDFSMTSAAWSP